MSTPPAGRAFTRLPLHEAVASLLRFNIDGRVPTLTHALWLACADGHYVIGHLIVE